MKRFGPRVAGMLSCVIVLAYSAAACAQAAPAQEAPAQEAPAQKTPDQKVNREANKEANKEVAKKEQARFLRILRNEKKQPIALETSIATYVPKSGDSGLQVDLIGAVHIGDGLYYEKLNRKFAEYDIVLYELVAPEGQTPPKPDRRSDNPFSMIQKMMTVGLGLESQMERIDYSKKNFVHADMSPDEMAEAMKKRGDNMLTVAMGVMTDMIRQYNLQELDRQRKGGGERSAPQIPEVDPLSLILDPAGPKKMKRVMAEQFEQSDMVGGIGPTLNTLLVEDRNKAALKVFQQQLTAGKKKIAIFYGAAHMPDFQQRLTKEYGLKHQNTTWLTAWDLERDSGSPLLKLLEPLGN